MPCGTLGDATPIAKAQIPAAASTVVCSAYTGITRRRTFLTAFPLYIVVCATGANTFTVLE
jgi:hypothetical protein